MYIDKREVDSVGQADRSYRWTYMLCMLCRLGVLIEVNCETDFVARGAKFKELVQDLAMQAAASPSAIVVSLQDVPDAEIERERAIEMGKEDIQNKPEAIRSASDSCPTNWLVSHVTRNTRPRCCLCAEAARIGVCQ